MDNIFEQIANSSGTDSSASARDALVSKRAKQKDKDRNIGIDLSEAKDIQWHYGDSSDDVCMACMDLTCQDECTCGRMVKHDLELRSQNIQIYHDRLQSLQKSGDTKGYDELEKELDTVLRYMWFRDN